MENNPAKTGKKVSGYIDADVALGFVRTNCLFRKGRRTYWPEVDSYSTEDLEEEYYWNFAGIAKEDVEEFITDAMSNADLTNKQRKVVIMRVYNGLTFTQIGQEMETTRQGAHNHWLRALHNLRTYLEKQLNGDRQTD